MLYSLIINIKGEYIMNNNKLKKNKNTTVIYIIMALILVFFIGIKIGNYEPPKKKKRFGRNK